MRPAVLERKIQRVILALIGLGLGGSAGAMAPEFWRCGWAFVRAHPGGYGQLKLHEVVPNYTNKDFSYSTTYHPQFITTVRRAGNVITARTDYVLSWGMSPRQLRKANFDEMKVWHQLFDE